MRNIAKWRCQLTEYDIEYVPRTSIKEQAIADHLAEFSIDDDTPINTDFPDEGILQIDEAKEEPTWKMYFDRAINSVGSGVGAVLISPDGRHYPVTAKVDFSCTNNVAEYEACILDLQAAIDFEVKELEVFGVSMLIIFQTLGQWKTKDAKLVPYHEYLEELAKNFEKISFTYTPRAKNQFADALATLASMASISEGNIIEPLEIEVDKGPAYCSAIEASEAKPWYEDIRNFLQTGQYPPFADRRDRKTLRRLAMHYFLSGEILYRRSFDSTLLRCIDEHESRQAEWAKQRYEQLNLIDEKRLKALCHGQCYQQRMARAFNTKVRHREFNPGDLVLRKILHVAPDSRGKFSYKYDGPFVVKETFSGGAVVLSDMDGTENALPVNADAIKKYYP
ncbi:uncharacterized protein LOC116193740 [Punica granatum]|uniref:Uncharacterized protein LOC116193740 n=1 Tax=Punica granatum TaxID=22663 RepID=A0A6P8C6D9_PUNGR|nr:uncharacterized protein LOC116193740 [Punica granatum]